MSYHSELECTGYYQLMRNKILLEKYPHIGITINDKYDKYFFHHATEDDGDVSLYFYNVQQFENFPFEDIFKIDNTSALFYETLGDSTLMQFVQICCNQFNIDKPNNFLQIDYGAIFIIYDILVDVFSAEHKICIAYKNIIDKC